MERSIRNISLLGNEDCPTCKANGDTVRVQCSNCYSYEMSPYFYDIGICDIFNEATKGLGHDCYLWKCLECGNYFDRLNDGDH